MRLLKRKDSTDGFRGSDEELFAEIERLQLANRAQADRSNERRLLELRHLAGMRLIEHGNGVPEFARPDFEALGEVEGVPEIVARDLTPELLRAAILRHGCLLVRALVERDDALRFADEIDRGFRARADRQAGRPAAEGYYEEFEPAADIDMRSRGFVQEGGGVLAADSPTLHFEMLEMFDRAALPALVRGYLGEAPVLSAHKTTLRKAEPTVGGSWHQDGAFMGEVRALNLWLSLSRCGDEAPGLDIVPRRLNDIVVREEEMLLVEVAQQRAREAAGDLSIVRPIFEPGDALFFDELFLHQTASDPSMPNPRYAIESWFFGRSAFARSYAPIAV